MTWLLILLTLPTLLLALTFERALTRREPWLLAFASAMNVMANYGGLLLLFWDVPKRGEWTFSKRLPRLCQLPGWRGSLARHSKEFINKKVPGHIP